MQNHTRRNLLFSAALLSVGTLAGCVEDGDRSGRSQTEGTDGAVTTGDGTATDTPATTTGPTGVHDSPYAVNIRVTARAVEAEQVPISSVPTLSEANLTDAQQVQLVDVIERGETDPWSGQSDETPPKGLRDLVAATDRLPPSRASRNPDEAWRVARETTGYVLHENTIYRVGMVKVAP